MKNNKIKAQAFDCMQYFYGEVQEPRIRCCVRFNDHISETALKRAVGLSVHSVPLISCVFDERLHCWKEREFTADNIIRLVEVPAGDENVIADFLLTSVDHSIEPQLRIILVREETHDTLCIIINHMICDGTGFKEYLYLLCDLYSKCERSPEYDIKPQPLNKRDLNQLLKNLGLKEKLDILFSKSDFDTPDPAMILPIRGDSQNPMIVITHIEKEQFTLIRHFAKERHTSLNDVLLTGYMRALRRVTGCKNITVQCPVDLRKYKKADQRCGICNLTGNYWCSAEISLDEPFADTLEKVSGQMRTQKESSVCLKGPMLLHMIFHMLPLNMVRKLFNRLSPVPITNYTNLGSLDEGKFSFGNHTIDDAFISTAVKKAPYFQLSISTFQGRCTLTSSLYGMDEDRKAISSFFDQMLGELSSIN